MSPVEQHVDLVCAGLNLPSEIVGLARDELLAHTRDAVARRRSDGVQEDRAVAQALAEMGEADEIRERYRSVYYRRHVVGLTGRLVGICALFACLAWPLSRSSPDAFVNATSMLFVLWGSAVLLLGTFSFDVRTVVQAIVTSLKLMSSDRPPGLETARHVLRTWAAYSLGCGAICLVLGTIIALVGHDTPESVGPSLAYAILGGLCSLVFAAVLLTLSGPIGRAPLRSQLPAWHPGASVASMAVLVALGAYVWCSHVPGADRIHYLIRTDSLLLLVVGFLALTIATYGVKDGLLLVPSALRPTGDSGERSGRLRTMGLYFAIGGAVLFLIDGVTMLGNFALISELWVAIATALVPMLYGIVLGMACWVLAGPAVSQSGSKPGLIVNWSKSRVVTNGT